MRRALEPEEFELYDLRTDPDERYNLFGKVGYEQLTSHLKDRLIALRKETSDTFECQAHRPAIAPNAHWCGRTCRAAAEVGRLRPRAFTSRLDAYATLDERLTKSKYIAVRADLYVTGFQVSDGRQP